MTTQKFTALLLLCSVTFVDTDTSFALTVTAVVGQKVTLPCLTSKTTTVDWRFQPSPNEDVSEICRGGKVINGFVDRFSIGSHNNRTHNLIIHEALRKDSGVYTCIEESGIGKEHVIQLNVAEADALVSGMVGQRVTLPCNASESTLVDWRFQPSPNEEVSEICRGGKVINGFIDRFAIGSDNNGRHVLIIHEAMRNDAGVYTCIEESGVGNEHVIQLNVAGHLFSSGTAMVSANTLVVLRCILNNTLVFRWHVEHGTSRHDVVFNGKNLSDKYSVRFRVRHERGRSDLIIQSVQKSDMGIYVCSPETTAKVEQKFELIASGNDVSDAAVQKASTSAYFHDDQRSSNSKEKASSRVETLLWVILVLVVMGLLVLTGVAVCIFTYLRFGQQEGDERVLRHLNTQGGLPLQLHQKCDQLAVGLLTGRKMYNVNWDTAL